MISFSRKPVLAIEPLGSKLRAARECTHMTIEAAATRTVIPLKYLQALEASRYRDLPGDVYVRNFLRTYATFLKIPVERVLELYEDERRVVTSLTKKPSPPTELAIARNVHLPKLLRRAAIVAGVLVLLVYLGSKVQKIVEPPPLTVSAPSGDVVTPDRTLQIEGNTAAESTVRINGQEIFLDPSGHFSEHIDLQLGLNVIKVSSQKERSREQVVYRQVIVEDGPSPAISSTTEFHP